MNDLEPRDVAAYWKSLTGTEYGNLSRGEVASLVDEAVQEIERLRRLVGPEPDPVDIDDFAGGAV